MDKPATPANVGSMEGLGLTFDALKETHDKAWDALCDSAPNGTFADLIVVGALRKKFLTDMQALFTQRDRLREALLDTSRRVEALKRECGMDPESPQALRNGRYMSIAWSARAAAEA